MSSPRCPTLGPKGRVPSKCPRHPHQLWLWLEPPLAGTQALGTARKLGRGAARRTPTLPTPPASAFSSGVAQGQNRGDTGGGGVGAGWRPYREVGKGCRDKNKTPELPPEVVVGAQRHPSHKQDELCTHATRAEAGKGYPGPGPAGQEGGWAWELT